MRWLRNFALVLLLAGAALWLFGPYEPVDLTPSVTETDVGDDVEAYFAAQEARFDDITPGVEKRVIWAGPTGESTEWVVVYVHGFSATSEEIRPVPDRVADALNANLVYTRLRGHGRTGDAMAEAKAQDWINDAAEALIVARRIGQNILVISTSTGGTVMAAAAQSPEMIGRVRGAVFVSPNLGVNNPQAAMLTWPAARWWLPKFVGERRSFEPESEGQAIYWTSEYPTVAVLPMAALVKQVAALPHETATIPALFYFSPDDQVVRADVTAEIAARWGKDNGISAQVVNPALGDQDDPGRHVIAGDIVSPGQTDRAVAEILEFVEGL